MNRVRVVIVAMLGLWGANSAQAGEFTRLFPELSAYNPPEEALKALAAGMVDPNADADNNPRGTTSISTYWGQEADHELVRTDIALAEALGAPLVNKASVRFDLDTIYGRGPGEDPQFYEADGRFKLSAPNGFSDYPRETSGRAIINEPRNDENLVIAQFQILWMRYHNLLIAQGLSFDKAREQVTHLWGYLTIKELLPKFVGQEMVDRFLTYNGAGKPKINTPHYKVNKGHEPGMPLEFAAAAYRFGHSQVRLAYTTKSPELGQAPVRTQVFNAAQNDLHGGRAIPTNLKIDWENFTDIPGVERPIPPQLNIQRAIDSLISRSLFFLPEGSAIEPNSPPSLAERNLLRGRRIGLPSYQAVSRALGLTPLSNEQLSAAPGLEMLAESVWEGEAPLWAGILGESKLLENGEILGPTGGMIVAETFLGILDADKQSYVNEPRAWTPPNGLTTIGHLIKYLGQE